MRDHVTHEGDLDPRAASEHRRLGTERAEIRLDSRPRSAPAHRPYHAGQRGARGNRFATWKPLKKFAAMLDRPVRGTPVETIVSEDRDR
jgi:hypothetical protein